MVEHYDARFEPDGEISRPGISTEFLRRHSIRHIDEFEAEALIGFKASGIIIPYPGLASLKLMVNGREFGRLRLDHPTSAAKYFSPRGCGAQLYVPQGPPFGKELVVCEGEFKAMALCESGIRAVALGGISSAMPGGTLLPDLAKILRKYEPLTVYFLGDADTCLIFDFSYEAIKLANALPQGCTPKLPRIPVSMPKGIDDCCEALGAGFLDFWRDITENAITVSSKMSPDALAVQIATRELPAINSHADRAAMIPMLMELGSHLDPLHLGILAKAASESLDLPVVSFRESAKQVASQRRKEAAEKFRQTKAEHASNDRERFTSNDAGRADRFVSRFKDEIRFLPERGIWLTWDGGRWQIDSDGALERRSILLSREMLAEAALIPGTDKTAVAERETAARDALAFGDRRNIADLLALAKVNKSVLLPAKKLDADPWIVGAGNAIIDLRTGEVREYGRDDYVTKRLGCKVNVEATCPRFKLFLTEIFPDPEVRQYMIKAAGYSLTGIVSEQCFWFLHGTGQNGKSKLIEILEHVLGSYAARAGTGIIAARKPSDYPLREMADVVGVRALFASETEEGEKLNECVIKDLTGCDSLRAEHKYERAFTFLPNCKLWIAGNHKPTIRGTDTGIWRRVRLIPFERKFEGTAEDKALGEKLRSEASGILNLLVAGCLLWQNEGLNPPKAIVNAVADYRAEEDTLAEFIEECTIEETLATVTHGQVFKRYQEYAQTNGVRYTLSSKKLAKRLRERGWQDTRSWGCSCLWQGVRLRES
jgi:putative DNA primase/helicase